MTAIVWDQVGERRYETGIDRGVLYVPPVTIGDPQTAVPWNGLTSISEKATGSSKAYFLDGIKYMERYTPGAYEATLNAFTYPDELDELVGNIEIAPGARIHNQRSKIFHLAYRTKVGNDVDGVDHDYKIHLIWNVIALSSDQSYESISKDVTAPAMSWDLKGVPQNLAGHAPVGHIALSANKLSDGVLENIEATLYGTVDQDPQMPDFDMLLTLLGVGL